MRVPFRSGTVRIEVANRPGMNERTLAMAADPARREGGEGMSAHFEAAIIRRLVSRDRRVGGGGGVVEDLEAPSGIGLAGRRRYLFSSHLISW